MAADLGIPFHGTCPITQTDPTKNGVGSVPRFYRQDGFLQPFLPFHAAVVGKQIQLKADVPLASDMIDREEDAPDFQLGFRDPLIQGHCGRNDLL